MQIQRADLIDQVYIALRSRILEGVLNPEKPLRQEELAEQLGVSRQPISHALLLLEREGLVSDYGRKGKMVAPVNASQLRNLYQVRGALDGLAAYLCAEQTSNRRKDLFASLIAQGESAVQSGSVKALADADVAFHRTLYEQSGNPEILRVANHSWTHMERSMHQVLAVHSIRPGIWNEHRAISNAIINQNPSLARDLASEHAVAAGQMTYERLTTSL